jgi:hypothetical protein
MGSQRPDTSEPGSSFTLMKPREGTLGSNCAGLAQVGQIQSLGEILDAKSCGQFEQDDRRCRALPYWIQLFNTMALETPDPSEGASASLLRPMPQLCTFQPNPEKKV